MFGKKMMSSITILVCLILCAITVSAIPDATADVYHYQTDGSSVNWELTGERDAIDITDLSMTTEGDDVSISLSIKGGVIDDPKIFYYAHLQTNPTSYYAIYYTDGSGMATGNGDLAGYVDTKPSFSMSDDGTTLSYTFTDVGNSDAYELWGYAVEHQTYGDVSGEAWYDYAPNTKAPYYSGGGDSGDGPEPSGTPGFEILYFLSAVVCMVILLRKKHFG